MDGQFSHGARQEYDATFESALLENLAVLVDALAVISEEALHVGDDRTADFVQRVASVLRAFVATRTSGQLR